MPITPLCTPEIAVNQNANSGLAVPVRCKRWSCPVCHQANRRKVIRIAKSAKPRALLTLTVSSKDYPCPQEAAEELKRALRLLRLRLKRSKKLENFEFLAVFEKHKSGHPHLHLLIKGSFLPWKDLRRMWEEMTGSYMVDIRKISSHGQAAMYCAKYIGKDLSSFQGCKRWWRSRGYSDGADADYQPEHLEGQWGRIGASFLALPAALEECGWEVQIERGERITWRRPDTGPPPRPFMDAIHGRIGMFRLWHSDIYQ